MKMQGTYAASQGVAAGSHFRPIRATPSTCALAATATRSQTRKDGVAPVFHFGGACLGAFRRPGRFLHASYPDRRPVQAMTRRSTIRIVAPNARICFIHYGTDSEEGK